MIASVDAPGTGSTGGGLLTELDHVGIAVRDLDAAMRLLRQRLRCHGGAPRDHRVRRRGGGAHRRGRLLHPAAVARRRDDSPVAKFLERHGEGLHHVGYRVDDCAAALEAVRATGGKLIDEEPRPGSRGTTVAFVHPKGAFGTLVELVQEPS